MAQRILSLSVELPDAVLLRLLSVGGILPERRAEIGQAIADAGVEFLRGVIARNGPTDAEVASHSAAVDAALGQVIALVGGHDAAAVKVDAVSQCAEAITLLLDIRQRVRTALRAEAIGAACGGIDDPSVRATTRAEVAARVDRVFVDLAWLKSLAAEAARRAAFAAQTAAPRAVPPDRSPKVPGSLASAVYKPRVSGAKTRRDEAVNRFLWQLWHVHMNATEVFPHVTVVAPTKSSRRRVQGEVLSFCKACLEWIGTQIPADLKDRDPQLLKALVMREEAIHDRLRRVVDYGSMSRTRRQPRAEGPPIGN